MTSVCYDSSMNNNSKPEVNTANTVMTSSTRDLKDSFLDVATWKKSVDVHVIKFHYVLTCDKIT